MTKDRAKSSAAFTLVELLIGATLSAAIMAAVLSSYIYLGRSVARLTNQQALETEARRALGYFTKDVQTASGLSIISIAPTSPATNRVDLIVPMGVGNSLITYYYNNTPSAATVTVNGTNVSMPANSLTRCVYNGTTVTSLTLLHLRNINDASVSSRSDLTIRYYDSSGREYSSYINYLFGIEQLSLEFNSANGNNVVDQTTAQSANYQAASSRLALRNRSFLP